MLHVAFLSLMNPLATLHDAFLSLMKPLAILHDAFSSLHARTRLLSIPRGSRCRRRRRARRERGVPAARRAFRRTAACAGGSGSPRTPRPTMAPRRASAGRKATADLRIHAGVDEARSRRTHEPQSLQRRGVRGEG